MSLKNPRVARRYAWALMSVAEERTTVDATADALAMVGRTLAASRELTLLLASPVVSEGRKAAVLRALFEGRVDPLSLGFLELVVKKHREVFLEEVIAQFQLLRDELRHVVTVEVTAATPLDEAQQQTLRAALERRTGKTVRLHLAHDARILGGLVVKIGDTVLDASVTHQLARLRERFAGTARHSTLTQGTDHG